MTAPAGEGVRTFEPACLDVTSEHRDIRLDVLRGVAVLLMIFDHLLVQLDPDSVLRSTVTRLALPAFFILAGHLAGALRWRHAGIAALGLVLPLVVPWIDAPNVLVWWALGCVVLVVCRRFGVPAWLLIAFGLTVAANGYSWTAGTYDPAALIGFMALGSILPRASFSTVPAGPRLVATIGRHPVAWYLGHLLVLQALIVWGVL